MLFFFLLFLYVSLSSTMCPEGSYPVPSDVPNEWKCLQIGPWPVENIKDDIYPRPMHLVILFDGSDCNSVQHSISPQVKVAQDIMSNYTIGPDLYIGFGTPIISMQYSMSKLYYPETPALAFLILMNSNRGIEDAISFRKSCLDPANAAVIVIQMDENNPIDSDLASRPEFFLKYDGTTDIVANVNDALMKVDPYKIDGYTCECIELPLDTKPLGISS